jgi:hypothetical protein
MPGIKSKFGPNWAPAMLARLRLLFSRILSILAGSALMPSQVLLHRHRREQTVLLPPRLEEKILPQTEHWKKWIAHAFPMLRMSRTHPTEQNRCLLSAGLNMLPQQAHWRSPPIGR